MAEHDGTEDLTTAYMLGRHDGRKDAERQAQALSAPYGSRMTCHLETGTVKIQSKILCEMARVGNKADNLRYGMIERQAKELLDEIMCRTGKKFEITISENTEIAHSEQTTKG